MKKKIIIAVAAISIIAGLVVLFVFVAQPVMQRRVAESKLDELPEIEHPFDLDKYGTVEIDEVDNAIPLYRRAIEIHDELDVWDSLSHDQWSSFMEVVEQHDWEKATPAVADVLAKMSEAMRVWREGSRLPRALQIQPKDRTGLAGEADVAMGVRSLVRLAIAEAIRLEHEGKVAEAWQWYRACLRASRHLAMHGILVDQLLAKGIYVAAAHDLSLWSADSRTSADLIQETLTDVRAINSMTTSFSDILRTVYFADKYLLEQTYQKFEQDAEYRQDVINDLEDAKNDNERTVEVSDLYMALEPQLGRRILPLLYANWLAYADTPWHKQPPLTPNFHLYDATIQLNGTQRQIGARKLETWYSRSWLAMEILPDMRLVIQEVEMRDHLVQRGLLLTLALQLYHRDQGEFPRTLAKLQGKYLDRLPIDPFGQGEPLRYRRTKERATVWSLWTDGSDEQGKVDRLDAPRGPHCDYVFRISPPTLPATSSAK